MHLLPPAQGNCVVEALAAAQVMSRLGTKKGAHPAKFCQVSAPVMVEPRYGC
jgi:hypothetical protein